MKICLHVFKHELLKLFTDKKLLISMFLMPLVIVLTSSFLTSANEQQSHQTLRIYALGDTVNRQVADGFEIVPTNCHSLEELQETITLTSSDVVLDIQKDHFTIYYNSASAVSTSLAYSCEQFLADTVLTAYAQANKVDISNAITVTDINRSPSLVGQMIASMLPYMLVLLLFQSTASFAVETIAGEKERGVFSKTLLAPASPVPIITGKLLSSTFCGLLSCGIYIFIVVLFSKMAGSSALSLISAASDPLALLLLLACAVLLSYFFANISVLCSLYAGTVKEAQALTLPIYGITMVLAIIAMLKQGTAPLGHYLIPIYNICIMMQDILSVGAHVEHLVITVLSLLACSALTATITIVSFKNESIRY